MARHSFSRIPIPLRGIAYTPSPPCARTGESSRWLERNALNHQGPGLVCTIIRGMLPYHPNSKRFHIRRLTHYQDITNLRRPNLEPGIKERLLRQSKPEGRVSKVLSEVTHNPSLKSGQYRSLPQANGNGNGNGLKSSSRRYFAAIDDAGDWPPELHDYNRRFSNALEVVKRRHDSVVTTVGKNSGIQLRVLLY